MENQDQQQQSLIRYLLGDLEEEERRCIEEHLLRDHAYYQLLLVTEDELIDSYVAGELSGRELEQFETHFLRPPQRLEKVEFARALQTMVSERAGAEAGAGAMPAIRRL